MELIGAQASANWEKTVNFMFPFIDKKETEIVCVIYILWNVFTTYEPSFQIECNLTIAAIRYFLERGVTFALLRTTKNIKHKKLQYKLNNS